MAALHGASRNTRTLVARPLRWGYEAHPYSNPTNNRLRPNSSCARNGHWLSECPVSWGRTHHGRIGFRSYIGRKLSGIMARPKAKLGRSCVVCMSTLKRHVAPRPHYANGLCEMHYRKAQRKKPECQAAGCGARLAKGHSRQGHCRMHEPLLLNEPIRTAEAMARTMDRFVGEISPSREGLEGLFGC